MQNSRYQFIKVYAQKTFYFYIRNIWLNNISKKSFNSDATHLIVCESEKGDATGNMPQILSDEEKTKSSSLILPPLISSDSPSVIPQQQNQSSLLSSSLCSDKYSDIRTTSSSSPFNLLHYPALKKFMDVQASQRKSTPHISAFSSIKPKTGNSIANFKNNISYHI